MVRYKLSSARKLLAGSVSVSNSFIVSHSNPDTDPDSDPDLIVCIP